MTVLRHALRLSTVAGLAVVPVLALAPTAFAAHESNNRLDFDVVDSSSTADGAGTINYVKGASGDSEENSVWQQSLRFTGLEPGAAYSVVVQNGDGEGQEGPGTKNRTICDFTATDSGTGSCTGRFLELRALAVAQLQKAGVVVAQATRPASGPGEISSKGGCREPEQAGSQCDAPGRR